MKGLLAEVAKRQSVDRGEAMETYRRLLYGEGDATTQDVDELARVMEALRKTSADVEADQRAVEEYRRWAAQAMTEAQAGADIDAAWRAIVENNEAFARAQQEHRAKHNRLTAAHMDTVSRRNNAREAGRRASLLRAKHAEALGGLADCGSAACAWRVESVADPHLDGPRGGVTFQGGVGFTTDEHAAARFPSPAYRVVHIPRKAAESAAPPEPPAPVVAVTTTEPIGEEPPADASGATEGVETAAEPSDATNAPQTATGGQQSPRDRAAHVGTLGQASHAERTERQTRLRNQRGQ